MLPSSSVRLLDQDQHLEVAAHFHRQGRIRLAQGAGVVPGYLGGLSRSRFLCLQLSSHLPHHLRACLALRKQGARLNRQRPGRFQALRRRVGDRRLRRAGLLGLLVCKHLFHPTRQVRHRSHGLVRRA